MNLPLVSIVITSYNRSQWMGQAIESALAQDYPELEIIISDNCSADNSDAVIRKYIHDPRIRYSTNDSNIGMIANLQRSFFELAKGEYIINISSDDYLVDTAFVTKAINIINRNENIAIVFGVHNILKDKTNTIISTPLPGKYDIECRKGTDIFLEFADHPHFSSAGAVYSMRHLRNNNIRFSGWITADIEINLLLMLHGNIGFLNDVVYVTREHDHNASASFGDSKTLAGMYLDVYKYIYEKAMPVFKDEKLLKNWLEKLIAKNIMICLHTIIAKKERKQMFLFNKLLFKEYRKDYLLFLTRHPRYFAKIILNK